MDRQRIDHVRMSGFDRNRYRQLEAVSVARIFNDKASGKDIRFPGLDRLLAFMCEMRAARLPS
jgi:hypothetical protein